MQDDNTNDNKNNDKNINNTGIYINNSRYTGHHNIKFTLITATTLGTKILTTKFHEYSVHLA